MCERNDTPAGEVAGNLVYQRFKKQLTKDRFKTKCRKCNTREGYVLLQKKDIFCGECLADYCRHKFRATMGKSKLLKPGVKVLVGCSGGNASVALVDMVKVGLAEDIHRRLKFVPAVVHVDESILNPEESAVPRRALFDFLASSGLDFYLTSIESSTSSVPHYLRIAADDIKSIDSTYALAQAFLSESRSQFGSTFLDGFNSLASLSSKHDFVSRLRVLQMASVTKEAGFRGVFVATTASELSVSLMSHISIGRGVELQSEMSFCDDRFPSVAIFRPLREFTQKELAFYCRYRGLSDLILKPNHSTSTAVPIKSSIHRLTENFLNSLAEEFPSTIYTVFKTGNKITASTSTDSNEQVQQCHFCWAKIDTQFQRDRDEYSAFEALQLTSALSVGADIAINSDATNGGDSVPLPFCYSCLRLNSEMNSSSAGGIQLERFCISQNL